MQKNCKPCAQKASRVLCDWSGFMFSALLDREGWRVSRKLVQKIRREEGLKVIPKQKKIPRQGISTGLPQKAECHNL